ncbi:MAG TPA: cytidylate kinase family protein [Candidatus Sulfopaludibacter sp.]|nr:cytidylate kinase family protein [Candidatus Sulfopaludibacter sp.]
MSVITISRGSFSGGKMLAECLSKSLGYRCVDRDVIVERAAAHGVTQEELRDALQKPPTFLERFQHKKYLYLVLIQAALAAEVRTGKAVYHGNAGHLLLRGGPHVLRVRIIAPIEFRVKMAQERLKRSREEVLDYIAKMDQDRRKWTQYLYGVDWGDPANYDIVLNLEFMKIQDGCEAVSTLARQRCFEFTPRCQAAMDDLALASRVRAELALDAATSHLEFEVESKQGAVRIRGAVSNMRDVEEVQRISTAVPGVTTLNLDEVASPVRS